MCSTPLARAVEKQDEGMVELLLNRGADPDPEDDEYDMPLLEAVRLKNHNLVELLRKRRAKIFLQDEFGFSPFWWAYHDNDKSMLKLLLGTTNDFGSCPQHSNCITVDLREEGSCHVTKSPEKVFFLASHAL
ncbi:hypothetical protein F5884DRAFT_808969 [Xylogone sp. PMI_703]|nr:hypothetical protein F5884DRAFT_808623 [Xylogone sp. PMI_703]KAH8800829.1 hypothetical protein F5884DRAFT_808969 [Xylogone sp. PMI_703]